MLSVPRLLPSTLIKEKQLRKLVATDNKKRKEVLKVARALVADRMVQLEGALDKVNEYNELKALAALLADCASERPMDAASFFSRVDKLTPTIARVFDLKQLSRRHLSLLLSAFGQNSFLRFLWPTSSMRVKLQRHAAFISFDDRMLLQDPKLTEVELLKACHERALPLSAAALTAWLRWNNQKLSDNHQSVEARWRFWIALPNSSLPPPPSCVSIPITVRLHAACFLPAPAEPQSAKATA